jgi:hypothetical protein
MLNLLNSQRKDQQINETPWYFATGDPTIQRSSLKKQPTSDLASETSAIE